MLVILFLCFPIGVVCKIYYTLICATPFFLSTFFFKKFFFKFCSCMKFQFGQQKMIFKKLLNRTRSGLGPVVNRPNDVSIYFFKFFCSNYNIILYYLLYNIYAMEIYTTNVWPHFHYPSFTPLLFK